MEGYSVTEAASVLGVPTERVWELLARGVLSGSPEGETGMRVFLQPRPAPAPVEARPANGGSEPARELSPFRELLTEFRNLTERYGQALLALGEARGEVAALRSRVDLLEARMDLRLPMGAGAAAGWGSSPVPMPAEQATASPLSPAGPHDQLVAAPSGSRHRRGEPHAPPEAEALTHDDAQRGADEEEHRGRRRGPRRATESFAEALARAEDPSAPELPARPDAATAAHADGPTDAPDLPREGPAAEAVLVAEEADVASAPISTAPEPAAPEPTAPKPAAGPGPMTEPEIAPAAEREPVEAGQPGAGAVAESTVEPVMEIPPATGPTDEIRPPTEEGADEPEPVEATAADDAERGEAAARTEPEPGDDLEGLDAADQQPGAVAEAVAPPTSDAPEPAHLDVAADEPIQAEAQVEIEPDAGVEAAATAAAERDEAVARSEPSATMAAEGEPIVWDSERYTTTIEEPDWFAAEVYEAPPAIEPAGEGPERPSAEPGPEPVDVAADTESPPPPEQPATSPSGSVGWLAETREETVLWFGREPANEAGAAEMEVAATSTTPESGAVAGQLPRELPGADELHEALAALEAPGPQPSDAVPPPTTGGETATPEPGDEATPEPEPDEWPPRTPSAAREPWPTSAWSVPAATAPPGGPRAGSTGPATSGPASRAYRRLRRIFPG